MKTIPPEILDTHNPQVYKGNRGEHSHGYPGNYAQNYSQDPVPSQYHSNPIRHT